MSSDETVKATWSSVFRRKGGSGAYLRLWDEQGDATRDAALMGVVLELGELPVLCASGGKGSRFVLTTRHLICGDRKVPISSVIGVRPPDLSTTRKRDLNELAVETSGGEHVTVESEPGGPYSGLWNVLLHISRHNARKSDRRRD